MNSRLRRLTVLPALAVLAAATTANAARSEEVKGSFERTLKVTGPVELDVTTGSGDIIVRSGESGTVQIRGKIQAHDEGEGRQGAEEKVRYLEAHPPINQDGNHIRIGRVEDHEMGRNVSIDYELVVPAETQLTSQSGSGDVTVEGIRGPVDAKSGSGDMKLNSIRGNVQARAGSGDLKFAEIEAERVDIETGSGDVELRDLRTSLRAQTGSGDITAEGNPTGEWVLHAGSGGVSVRLASQIGFDLDAHTSSGDISTKLPITVQGTMGHGELRGQVRGGGTRIELRTGSGDISIE